MTTRLGRLLRRLDEHGEKPVIVVSCLAALLLIPYQVFVRYFLGTWFHMNVDTSAVEELALFSLPSPWSSSAGKISG